MIEFCRKQATTKQGQIKISLLFSILFICAAVIGMTVFAQPYAVYATGEKVADPWLVSVDGTPIAVVDSEEAGKAVETGLRVFYGGDTFDEQQDIEMLNEITVTKYDFDDTKNHPVVMDANEVVDYIAIQNAEREEPIVGFQTQRYTTQEEVIKYDTVTLEDDSFPVGETEVTQKGVNGKKETTNLETLVNGKVVATEVVDETVLKEPVDKVVVKGLKEPEPEPEPEPEEEENTAQNGDYSTNGSSDNGFSSGSSSSSSSYVPAASASSTDLVSFALQFVGVPYVWGGESPSGWDCSGFVKYVFAQYGVSMPHSSYSMGGMGYAVPNGQQQPGDLVCYGGHVGIYIGNGQLVHASDYGVGTIVSDLSYRSGYWFRRVL